MTEPTAELRYQNDSSTGDENAIEMRSNSTAEDTTDDNYGTRGTTSTTSQRGHMHFITPRLIAVLDHAKVSDAKAIHILSAAASALGHNVADLVISRSALRNVRHQNRKESAEKILAENVV